MLTLNCSRVLYLMKCHEKYHYCTLFCKLKDKIEVPSKAPTVAFTWFLLQHEINSTTALLKMFHFKGHSTGFYLHVHNLEIHLVHVSIQFSNINLHFLIYLKNALQKWKWIFFWETFQLTWLHFPEHHV